MISQRSYRCRLDRLIIAVSLLIHVRYHEIVPEFCRRRPETKHCGSSERISALLGCTCPARRFCVPYVDEDVVAPKGFSKILMS